MKAPVRFIAILLLLFAIPFDAIAGICITRRDRIGNVDPGYCVWCSLEMLGRYHKIEALYGLLELRIEHNRKYPGTSGGTSEGIRSQLQVLKVSYYEMVVHTYDKKWLKYACDNGYGCMIAVSGYPRPTSYHAMVLIDIDDNWVTFIDPNDIEKTFTKSMAWFDKHWDGYGLIVEP